MAKSTLKKWSFVCTNRERINILFYYKQINKITKITTETHKHMKSLLTKTLIITSGMIIVVQSLSHVWLFVTPWTVACHASMSFTIFWSLLKFMYIELVIKSNHLILYSPLLLCLHSFSASGSFPMGQLFASGGQSTGASAWKSISPSNEYSGPISFRIDCLDLFTVQRTLKSLLQHHSSKGSILWCSAFFMVQL